MFPAAKVRTFPHTPVTYLPDKFTETAVSASSRAETAGRGTEILLHVAGEVVPQLHVEYAVEPVAHNDAVLL